MKSSARLAVVSEDPDELLAQGNGARALGRVDEAIAFYDRAMRLRPIFPEALLAGGLLLEQQRKYGEAERFYGGAIAQRPGYAEALLARGNLRYLVGRAEEAIADYDALVAVAPTRAEAHGNRGAALLQAGRLDEALAAQARALSLDPDMHQAWLNQGNALLKACKPDLALESYDRALALRPAYSRALCGKGIALKELARYEEALAAFDASLALDPDDHDALCNRATLLLLLGDFARGLDGYEHRWASETVAVLDVLLPGRRWEGEDPRGKSVLVANDHANGDTIQFCRYLPLLAAAGAEVCFACPPKLARLVSTLPANIEIVTRPTPGRGFDLSITLSSLPRAFGTRSVSIPGRAPYLASEPERRVAMARRIGDAGFRVGIAWRGNTNIRADPARSYPLSALAPLAGVSGVRLISLQVGDGADEATSAGFPVETLGADFDAGPDAFLDTAAAMDCLDLVITCDTSVAHLAGALARPVWVALKHSPEWRWMLDREDSPWYPTMRLFRQDRRGDWDGVFARMARELATTAAARRASISPTAPVSLGELVDKMTILAIKARRIADPAKLADVARENDALAGVHDALRLDETTLAPMRAELEEVNELLWDVEDAIRACEAADDHGDGFVALARAVPRLNDRRAAIKRDINLRFGSTLAEVKSYASL